MLPADRFNELLAKAAAPTPPDEAEDPAQLAAFRELRSLCDELERIAEIVPFAAVVPQMQEMLQRMAQLADQTGGIAPLPVHYSDQLDIALLRMRHGQWLVTTADVDRVKAHFLKWHAPDPHRTRLTLLQRAQQWLAFKLKNRYPPYYEAYRSKWVTQLPTDPELARHPGPTLEPAVREARRASRLQM